jgi:hypothetical protein
MRRFVSNNSCSSNTTLRRPLELIISPLEPDAVESKFYVPGIGNIQTVDVASGQHLDLVQIKTERRFDKKTQVRLFRVFSNRSELQCKPG